MSRPPTQHPPSPEEDALARHREELRNRFPLPNPIPRKSRKTLAATALLLVLGAGLAWVDPAYRCEQYSTDIGEHRELNLVDGSRMTLDSGTRVTVGWHLRTRRVALETGQALFDVSKTRIRPFQVNAGTTQVKVLGTLFSVRNLKDAVRVTLVRGTVAVSTTDVKNSVKLVPGQQVDVWQNQLQQPVIADIDSAISWKDHRLIFDHMPLAEALGQIQRYRKPLIVLDDSSLTSLPISGVFDNRNVENLLSLLPSILPLSLNTDADGTLHVRRRTAKK